jgi:hypothetical protein
MSKLLIAEHDSKTALWKKIKAHFEEKLELLRRQNDGNLSEAETQKLRGRIAEVKSILALDKPPPRITGSDEKSPPLEY